MNVEYASESPTLYNNAEKLKDLDGYIALGKNQIKKIQFRANTHVPERRYKGSELADLIRVTTQAIYKGESEGRLPAPDVDARGKRLGATQAQVMMMQEVFGTSPKKAPNEKGVVMAFTNFKGGCWKTTAAWYGGSRYAQLGYRVLFIDLDPQASLTLNCGITPDAETAYHTSLAPFITDVQEDDDPPVVYNTEYLKSIVRDTCMPNLKIIPSTLALAAVEYELTTDLVAAAHGSFEMRLAVFHRMRNIVEHFRDDFDLIIMDGTPSLGMLPLNIIFASDVLVVPVPTESNDFASTLTFCELYRDHVKMFNKAFGDNIVLPSLLFLPTRYSASEHSATAGSIHVLENIRKTFGRDCLFSVIRRHDSVVSNLTLLRRTVFQINPKDALISRDAIKRAVENFSEVYDEILKKAVFPRWPSKSTITEAGGR